MYKDGGGGGVGGKGKHHGPETDGRTDGQTKRKNIFDVHMRQIDRLAKQLRKNGQHPGCCPGKGKQMVLQSR